MCRKKKLFSWITSILRSQQIQIWMWHKKSVWTWNVAEEKFSRFVDRIHEIHSVEIKAHQKGKMWSGERLTKVQTTSRPDHIRPEEHGHGAGKPLKIWKTGMGNRESKTRKRQKFEKHLFHWSEWRRKQRHYQECEREIRDTGGGSNALQKIHKLTVSWSSEQNKHLRKLQRRDSIVLWKLMNFQDQEWNLWRRKIMNTKLQAKHKIQYCITIWCINLCHCLR